MAQNGQQSLKTANESLNYFGLVCGVIAWVRDYFSSSYGNDIVGFTLWGVLDWG